jgi:hypothetical protein
MLAFMELTNGVRGVNKLQYPVRERVGQAGILDYELDGKFIEH